MILRGLLRLMGGRDNGIAEFGNTAEAVAASLGPLIAFPLVTAGLTALGGQPKFAAVAFLSRLCAVLALPLITYEFARATKRDAFWARTVAALNWSFWPLVALAVAVDTAVVFGSLSRIGAGIAVSVLGGYLLWLQWFIIRSGLRLDVPRAALLVVLIDVAVIGLSAVPLLLAPLPQLTPG